MSKPLFLHLIACSNAQSVALAGVYLPIGLSVSLDEAGLRAAGVSQVDINAIELTAQLVVSDGSGGFSTVSRTTLVRLDIGVWGGFVTAPTVAGGAEFLGGIHIGLSDDIDIVTAAGTVRIADDAKANHVGCPAYFKRAAS